MKAVVYGSTELIGSPLRFFVYQHTDFQNVVFFNKTLLSIIPTKVILLISDYIHIYQSRVNKAIKRKTYIPILQTK